MKHTIQLIAFALLMFSITACQKVIGDGPLTTATRQHNGFTAISSSVDADIIFTQGQTYKVEINAQQNIIDRMKSEVCNGELRFYYPGKFDIGRHDPITIYITAPGVTAFTMNGSGDLRSNEIEAGNRSVRLQTNGSGSMYFSAIKAASVDANVVGSGEVMVAAGSTITENCDISGSGKIDLNGLPADNASASISGSGNISVWANKTLDVHISGSGHVYYRGTPHITTSISGSGKLSHQ